MDENLQPEDFQQLAPHDNKLLKTVLGVGIVIAIVATTGFLIYSNSSLNTDEKPMDKQVLGKSYVECSNNIQIEFQRQLDKQANDKYLCGEQSENQNDLVICFESVNEARNETTRQMSSWRESCSDAYPDEVPNSIPDNFDLTYEGIQSGEYDVATSENGVEPEKIDDAIVLVNDTLSSKRSLELNKNSLRWIEHRRAQVNANGKISYRNAWERWEYSFAPTTLIGTTKFVEEESAQTYSEPNCNWSAEDIGNGYDITDGGDFIARITTETSVYPPLVECNSDYIVYWLYTVVDGKVFNEIIVYDMEKKKDIYSKKGPSDALNGTRRATWAKIVGDNLYYIIRGDSKIYELDLRSMSEQIIVENPKMNDFDVNESYITYTVTKGGSLTEFLYLQKL